MLRLGLACVYALFAAAGCASSAPTPSPLTPIFVLDSGTASCAYESVGVDLVIEHAAARPGYLDCITVTITYPWDTKPIVPKFVGLPTPNQLIASAVIELT